MAIYVTQCVLPDPGKMQQGDPCFACEYVRIPPGQTWTIKANGIIDQIPFQCTLAAEQTDIDSFVVDPVAADSALRVFIREELLSRLTEIEKAAATRASKTAWKRPEQSK